MSKELYYEDFTIGQQLLSRQSYTIGKEEAMEFARKYDPQAQHIDEKEAKETLFEKLIVSGWHTAAVTMKLKTETELFDVAKGLVGMGIDKLYWPRPTLPGDTLRIVVTILDKRLSNSRPGSGILKYKVETFNQRDELAMGMETAVIILCRN